jgi:hypothetical protein
MDFRRPVYHRVQEPLDVSAVQSPLSKHPVMKQLLVFAALLIVSSMHGQSLEYAWLNQPCGTVLNCDSGCTACLMPEGAGLEFTGTAAVWQGIDACPHPVSSGDNAVITYGWPTIADIDHYVSISGIAFSPMHIDSIIIRHNASADGPQRLTVRYGANTTMPTTVVCDVATPEVLNETVVTDLGCVAAEDGMIYGFFQLLLQPYDGGTGAWAIDDLRIVASPCAATGIGEVMTVQRSTGSPTGFDALGRSIGVSPVDGMYMDGRKVIVIQ